MMRATGSSNPNHAAGSSKAPTRLHYATFNYCGTARLSALHVDWVLGTYQLRKAALIKAVRTQDDVPSHHELTRSARNNTYLYLLWCFCNYVRSTRNI